MNKLIFIFFTLLSLNAFGQSKFYIQGSTVNNITAAPILQADSTFILGKPNDSTSKFPTLEGYIRYFNNTHSIWYKTNISWTEQLSKLQSQSIITSMPSIGDTAMSASDFVGLFFKSQAPTATLTGGITLEFTSAGTVAETLNWSSGRQFATQPLASIVVAGITQSFSQPSAPGTVSGTQAVSVPANTTTTYNNITTTVDGKSATANTQFIFKNKMYVGYVSGASPTDGNIIAATGGNVGGDFTTSRLYGPTTLSSPGGTLYTVIAYPASFGLATIKVGGFVTTYNLTVRSFTNASGYTTSYNIYVSPFASAAALNIQVL